jgi:hypothetical protein
MLHGSRTLPAASLVVGAAWLLVAAGGAVAAPATYTIGPAVDLTSSCSDSSAEVEQATDQKLGYVYEAWMGCTSIAIARSIDGGRSFNAPAALPGSSGTHNAWDPAVPVGPNGTVYAAFMASRNDQSHPVRDASFDHGQTFTQVASLRPPVSKNWGDRDFIAVGSDGTVHVTWDYGPSAAAVSFICSSSGSCGYSAGDVNLVMQKSTDGGRTFGPMGYVSPGFPASGGDSGPLVVEPSGRIDVLYQDYPITNPTTCDMAPGVEEFSSSTDGGQTWSAPVPVGASAGTMSLSEWWIDGSIALDAAGNLYATWDTQGQSSDTGWISFSTDGGAHWSASFQASPTSANLPHIMEVIGGPPGIAYVGMLSDDNPVGYAQYVRTFSTRQRWLSGMVQVSSQYGDPAVWPGDTFGISTLSPPSSCSAGAGQRRRAARSRTSTRRPWPCSCTDRCGPAASGGGPLASMGGWSKRSGHRACWPWCCSSRAAAVPARLTWPAPRRRRSAKVRACWPGRRRSTSWPERSMAPGQSAPACALPSGAPRSRSGGPPGRSQRSRPPPAARRSRPSWRPPSPGAPGS